MKVAYFVYSAPSLDSANCDKRIERSIRTNLDQPEEEISYEDFVWLLETPFAVLEYTEIWEDGNRIDVIYPPPEEIVT